MNEPKPIKISSLRCSGRTTRLIDHYIQELFTTGEAILGDHFDSPEARKCLFSRLANRLSNEHQVMLVQDWRNPNRVLISRDNQRTQTFEVTATPGEIDKIRRLMDEVLR